MTEKTKKRLDPGVSSLLARVAKLGFTDQEIHDRACLPSGWLSQARSGRYSSTSGTCKRLLAWVDKAEGAAAVSSPTADDIRAVVAECHALAGELRQGRAELQFSQRTSQMLADSLLELFKEARRLGVVPPNSDDEGEAVTPTQEDPNAQNGDHA